MESDFLRLKRNCSLSLVNTNYESRIVKVQYNKRENHISPENRNINFIDEFEDINITFKINSKEELKQKLTEVHFNYPFYKIQNEDNLILNLAEFLHNTEINTFIISNIII